MCPDVIQERHDGAHAGGVYRASMMAVRHAVIVRPVPGGRNEKGAAVARGAFLT